MQRRRVLAGEIIDGDLRVGDNCRLKTGLNADSGQSHHRPSGIQNLVSRGLVEIRRGKGTFVSAPRIMQDLKS